MMRLAQGQTGKEINGRIRKSKQDAHHQNFLCLVHYKAVSNDKETIP